MERSSWTEVNDLNSGRRLLITTGTATAALSFGGNTPDTAKTEIWNGSSWTEVNDLNSARYAVGSSSTSYTDALVFGGYITNPSSVTEGQVANTETWDGTNWTEIAEINEGRYFEQAAGTQTAALIFGGDPGGPFTNKTESFTDKN